MSEQTIPTRDPDGAEGPVSMEDSVTRPTPAQEVVSAASPPAGSLWQGADGRTIRCRAVENGTLFFDVHMPDAGGWIENLSVTLELFHD